MATLFISDLHLDPERPEITDLFLRFLQDEARSADALYILGDFFEAWVGDDDDSALPTQVASALRDVARGGVPIYFMHGNRDFLLGRDYAKRAGMRVLPDPSVVMLYGRPALLMHGDSLCTSDAAYQAFRTQTRDPAWQRGFLSQPLAARRAFAAQARAASKAHQGALVAQGGMQALTDVTPDEVDALLQRFGVDLLIHGHTHRPDTHHLETGGRARRRVVLGDWYEQGSVLRAYEDGRLELSGLR